MAKKSVPCSYYSCWNLLGSVAIYIWYPKSQTLNPEECTVDRTAWLSSSLFTKKGFTSPEPRLSLGSRVAPNKGFPTFLKNARVTIPSFPQPSEILPQLLLLHYTLHPTPYRPNTTMNRRGPVSQGAGPDAQSFCGLSMSWPNALFEIRDESPQSL